mgnify:CR=1 FL=1
MQSGDPPRDDRPDPIGRFGAAGWRWLASPVVLQAILALLLVATLLAGVLPQTTPQAGADEARWRLEARARWGRAFDVAEALGVHDVYDSLPYRLLLAALGITAAVRLVGLWAPRWSLPPRHGLSTRRINEPAQAEGDASLARALDAEGLRLVPLGAQDGLRYSAIADRPARREYSLQTLAELSGEFRQAGVKMAVELLPRSCIGNRLAELECFVARLGDDVCGVCLDVNHGMDQYTRLPQWVETLGKNLITLHLSDYDGIDEKHWMPGKGVIDWTAFMAALGRIDYRGPFNFEVSVPGETPRELRARRRYRRQARIRSRPVAYRNAQNRPGTRRRQNALAEMLRRTRQKRGVGRQINPLHPEALQIFEGPGIAHGDAPHARQHTRRHSPEARIRERAKAMRPHEHPAPQRLRHPRQPQVVER